jgi:HAD superfamily hydrolase (TIGR01509 family)
VKGLIPLLQSLQQAGIPMGVATSTTKDNIAFTMDKLHLRPYFTVVIDVTMISKGKPDPEIYETAARRLKARPEDCVVFEDSLNGIKSAKSAHMKVIAVTTSHSPGELHMADKVIDDFTGISVREITQIASHT